MKNLLMLGLFLVNFVIADTLSGGTGFDSGVRESSKHDFVSVSYVLDSSSETMVLGSQPLDEIVGSGSNRVELKIGTIARFPDNNLEAKVYTYLWSSPDKNSELGIGIGGDLYGQYLKSVPRLGFFIGGQVGIGYQSVKGDTFQASSSVNKVTFISDKAITDSTTAEYVENNYVLGIGLNVGTTYMISKNLNFDIATFYRLDTYQFKYRTNEDSEILNSLTAGQDSVGVRFEIVYTY